MSKKRNPYIAVVQRARSRGMSWARISRALHYIDLSLKIRGGEPLTALDFDFRDADWLRASCRDALDQKPLKFPWDQS